jgi:serine/threonine protein kinase/tetratricopeptide (TPR) repeat protein
MSAERWAQLEPLIDAALELDPVDRRAYCARIAAGDALVGADLERLIAYADGRDSLLDAAAVDRFALLFDGDASPDDDLREQLQASFGATYTLERELGGGGMSRVFTAHERGLGRQVVMKVLTRELAAGISAERFGREIKLAASLQQANIVPLLAAGTAANLPYYTMPFVEGLSLKERLAREGALPIGDAVSVLRDIARALAFAHSRGVVHRDIKPGNVLLSGGTAVVTDFGIAKAIGVARGDPRTTDLTGEGASLGTPSYMSPEQAMGDPATDHRADIYSFGCVAYEMLAGRPPFVDMAVHKVIAAHLRETPRPVTEQRADVRPGVADLIARCLEKDPAHRPQNASELLSILDGTGTSPGTRRWSRQERRRAAMSASLAIVAAVGGLYVVMRPASAEEPLTFTAVPFKNLTRDPALAYRSEGIADEILTSIAKVPGIEIIGRSAARRYAAEQGSETPDAHAISRELGVRFVITGTFIDRDGRVTLSVQLNDSMARGEIWAGRLARDSKDFGSMSDVVVETILDTLRARFPGRVTTARSALGVGATGSEAYDAYLIGQELLRRRGAGVQQSVASFERAISLDSHFARAYAALATALQLRPYFVGDPPEQVRERTVRAARRALELDSTLADAHVALGSAYAGSGRWADADAEFRHAVALEPDNVAARQTFARWLVDWGRTADAMDQLNQARKLERLSPLISAWLSYAFFASGQTDSALAQSARAIQLDSTLLPATNLGALINLSLGRPDVARRLMAAVPPPGVMSNAAYVAAKLGDTAAANHMLNAMEASNPRPWFTDVARASVFLALGDSADALTSLERSARATGSLWIVYIPLEDPAYDILRPNPRFAALLRSTGADIARITSPRGGRAP